MGILLKWWSEAESNCRHADFQSAALPTELSNHEKKYNYIFVIIKVCLIISKITYFY